MSLPIGRGTPPASSGHSIELDLLRNDIVIRFDDYKQCVEEINTLQEQINSLQKKIDKEYKALFKKQPERLHNVRTRVLCPMQGELAVKQEKCSKIALEVTKKWEEYRSKGGDIKSDLKMLETYAKFAGIG